MEVRRADFRASFKPDRSVRGAVVAATPRSNLLRFQSKVWLDMLFCSMPNKPEVGTS